MISLSSFSGNLLVSGGRLHKLALLTILLWPCTTALCQTAESPTTPAVVPLKPVCFAKTAPIKELMDKVSTLATSFSNSPQAMMMPALLGALIGDPTMGSFVPGSDLAVVFFDPAKAGPMPFVVLAKLTAESPVRAALSEKGMTVMDRGGWTMVGLNAGLMEAVGEAKSLLAIAQKSRSMDIEIGVWLDRLPIDATAIAAGLRRAVEEGKIKINARNADANLEALADVFLTEMKTLESGMMGFNLGKETIAMSLQTKAKAGTPLEALFNQTTGGPTPSGEYLPVGQGMLSYVARFDPEACQVYCDSLLGRLEERAIGRAKALTSQFAAIVAPAWKLTDGVSAGSMDITPEGGMRLLQISGTRADRAHFLQTMPPYLDFVYKELIPAMMALDPEIPQDAQAALTAASAEFKSAVLKIGETPVDTVSTRMNAPDNPFATQTIHYAFAGSTLVTATQSADLEVPLKALAEGRKAAHSLAQAMPLAAGTALRVSFDLAALMRMGAAAEAATNPGKAAQLKAALEGITLDPVAGTVFVGHGKINLKLDLPVSSMARMAGLMQQLEAAQPAPASEPTNTQEEPEAADKPL